MRLQGYLADAMINYLALLGWNDGTEQEIFTVEELTQKFSVGRITKSPAVFDKVKLSWMNGQHLRALPDEQALPMIQDALLAGGAISSKDSPFVTAAVRLIKNSLVSRVRV